MFLSPRAALCYGAAGNVVHFVSPRVMAVRLVGRGLVAHEATGGRHAPKQGVFVLNYSYAPCTGHSEEKLDE